jgi:hypothetical protein
MALTEVACAHCQHHGYIPAGSLGRVLRCAACGHARLVRRGMQMVCARDAEDDADLAVATTDESRWSEYEDPKPVLSPKPPPKRRLPRIMKRRLTPRAPATEGV